MALHGTIQVNNRVIGAWSAVRTGDLANPLPDDVLTYRCTVRQDATLQGNPPISWKGEVQHRFGDGALALAAAVLGACVGIVDASL